MKEYQEVVVGVELLRLPLVPSESLGAHPVDCIINRLISFYTDGEFLEVHYAGIFQKLGEGVYWNDWTNQVKKEAVVFCVNGIYEEHRFFWSQRIAKMVWVNHESRSGVFENRPVAPNPYVSMHLLYYCDGYGILESLGGTYLYRRFDNKCIGTYDNIGAAQVSAFTDHCQRIADVMFGKG